MAVVVVEILTVELHPPPSAAPVTTGQGHGTGRGSSAGQFRTPGTSGSAAAGTAFPVAGKSARQAGTQEIPFFDQHFGRRHLVVRELQKSNMQIFSFQVHSKFRRQTKIPSAAYKWSSLYANLIKLYTNR